MVMTLLALPALTSWLNFWLGFATDAWHAEWLTPAARQLARIDVGLSCLSVLATVGAIVVPVVSWDRLSRGQKIYMALVLAVILAVPGIVLLFANY